MSYRPPDDLNIACYFLDDRIRDGFGERVALRTDDGTLSYADVRARSCRFASVLRDAGVRPEERVIVSMPDRPDFVAAVFGILRLGAVVVMVNPDLEPEGLRRLCAYTRARAAVVGGPVAGTFAELATSTGITVLDVDEGSLRDALAAAGAACEAFPSHRDDPAIWLFSGGTTGRPKAVVQSHGSFANTTELYAKGVLGVGPDDITISVPKLYFGYALGSNLFFPFSVGGSAVLFEERCTAEALFERIQRHRPTILVNVPTMVNRMVSDPCASDRDLSCLRLATSAGEALPPELHRRWDETFGVELLDGLGTAEMWHIFLSNRPGDVRPGTLGKPVPGFHVELRDENGEPVPDGTPGRLWVRGDSRAAGYWQEPEKSREAFRGGWYVSGDMLTRDADGYYAYCGRADDMLKVSGKWLSPGELEDCLLRHPAVKEVAVVGVPDAGGLVKPIAFVVLADGADDDDLAGELQDFARSRLQPYKYPREVRFVSDLPRTHLGKVDRGSLSRLGLGSPTPGSRGS
ncbi:MAG TPA: benzoate-CoA ligase family protein [Longimicrobiales bacterium]|nr:benzoate-CoA ligase family protein [Longimicrobiales bacterium]